MAIHLAVPMRESCGRRTQGVSHVRRWMTLLVCVLCLVASACGGVESPRWADSHSLPTEASATVESPRDTVMVTADPDVGLLVLAGIVVSDSSTSVEAPGAGWVSNSQFERGELVTGGDAILTFTPDLTEEQQFEREILVLEGELAAVQGDEAAVAASAMALAELDRSQGDQAQIITSPVAGVISGVRRNLDYPVDSGESLFTVSDPDDVVVQVSSITERSPLAVDDVVTARIETGERFDGTVLRVETDSNGSRRIDIALDGSPAPGQLVDVEVSVGITDRDVWVPASALHRSNGNGFLLLERLDGTLERLTVRIGRRTESHFEVLAGPSGQVPIAVGDELVLP